MITLMGLFTEATKAADAIDELHENGVSEKAIEVMTGVPFPEQSLGFHREWLRLPYIVLAGAFGGFLFGTFLSVITPILYPLSLGGRPIVTGPPAAIIIYVFTMMATIVSTFLGVLWEMGFPSFERKHYHKSITSGNIAIAIQCLEEQESKYAEIIKSHGGDHVHRSEKVEM